MSFLSFFKMVGNKTFGRWKEIGTYKAVFSTFGNDVYRSEVVRSCIRTLAEHTSKANAVCADERIGKLLNTTPNMYMSGPDFLRKVRTKLEISNTVFVYIQRDELAKVQGFYPVPYSSFEALEYNNGLFISFKFSGNEINEIVLPWEDLVVLRKDYNESDIAGDENNAIIGTLELIHTTNQGVANAVKATANLRGILKSTKAMLSPADIKKNKETFVKDYLSLENEGGIASLDATQEFTPITMNPTVTNWGTMREFRENVYRYFGVNDDIIMSNYTEAQMEAFYDARIEPFLVAFSIELTRKIFTQNEINRGKKVIFESNRIQYSSNTTKLAMVALVDRGAMTPNEWRAIFNLAPIEGGDKPIRRLDTAVVGKTKEKDDTEDEGGNEDGSEG